MRWWFRVLLSLLVPKWARARIAARGMRRISERLAADAYAFFHLDVRARPLSPRERRAFRRQLRRIARAHGARVNYEGISVWHGRHLPSASGADSLDSVERIPTWDFGVTFDARPPGNVACGAILEWLRAHPAVLEALGPTDRMPRPAT